MKRQILYMDDYTSLSAIFQLNIFLIEGFREISHYLKMNFFSIKYDLISSR